MSERKVGLLLVFAVLAVYLSLPNRNYSYDSAAYAWFIKSGNTLFHPHHLLYNPLGFLILRLLRALGMPATAMAIMQVINSLAGALGVWLFFRIVHRLSRNLFQAVVFSLLLAFSFGYWYNSIENEVHTIPLLLLLCILAQMVTISHASSQPGPSSVLRMGVTGTFAVLFHQIHLLFIPIVSFFLLREAGRLKRGLKLVLYCLSPYPILIGCAYLFAAQYSGALSGWSSFSGWSTLYASSHPRAPMGLINLRLALYGVPRAFLRATFLKNFLLNRTMGGAGIPLLLASLVVGLILLFLVFLSLKRARSVRAVQPTIASLLLVWLFVYGIFVLWWEPQNPEFWLATLPPVWILLSLGTEGIRKWIPLLLLAALFSANLAGEVIPNSSLERNETYQLVLELRSQGFTAGDLILIPDPIVEPYSLYFFDEAVRVSSLADVKVPSEEEKERVFSRVEASIEETLARGDRVFLSESELEPNPSKLHPTRWLRVSDYTDFYQPYGEKLRKVFSYAWDGKSVDMFELER